MDGMIQFRVDASEVKSKLNGTADRVIAALERQLQAQMESLQGKIVAQKLSGNPINQRSGRLAASVRHAGLKNDGQLITDGVEAGGGKWGDRDLPFYAKVLEDGSKPHDIFPKNKKALAFLMGAEVIPGAPGEFLMFRKHVHHPGTPAFHFMTDMLEQQREAIIAGLKGAVREAIAE